MAQAPTYPDLNRGLVFLAEQRTQDVVRRATSLHPIKRVGFGLLGFGLLVLVVGLVVSGHSPGMAPVPRFGAYVSAAILSPVSLYYTIHWLRGR